MVNASGRMITGEREDSLETIPNISAIVEDFANLGQGLVTSVETLTERWTFIE